MTTSARQRLTDAQAQAASLASQIRGLQDEVRQEKTAEDRRRLAEAGDQAQRDLLPYSAPQMAALYGTALEAVRALVQACADRESTLERHGRELDKLGGGDPLVYRGEGRTVIGVAGEVYESGIYAPQMLLALVVDQVNREQRLGLRELVPVSDGHPVRRYLEAGGSL